jgi:phytol kinase
VTPGAEWLAARPWLAIGVFLAAFLTLVSGLILLHRLRSPHPEITRKLLHTGSGLLTMSFPFLFHELWPVLLLTGGSALLVGALKLLPAARRHSGRMVDGVGRTTLGEIYFPIAVAVVFWLALGHSPLLFCVPILVLTLADATGALIGVRYGTVHYAGAAKSLEGSVAFVVVAFFCIHVPLLLWGEVGRLESLLISLTMALIVMLLEGSAWRGLDNLFIPIGGFFLLRAYLPMGGAELIPRLLVTLALLVAVLMARHQTTLLDDSLLAGAFLCYITWALAGWPWLVPPAVLFVAYAWISPPTPDNSRRIHRVGAILAVWAPAVVWLTLSLLGGGPALMYPFALVFACHLGIFGLSRLAHDYPDRPLGRLSAEAIAKSWVFMLVPFAVVAGPSPRNLALAALGIVAIAAAVGIFVAGEAHVRDVPLSRTRWLRQGLSAAAGSALGWLAMAAVDRLP